MMTNKVAMLLLAAVAVLCQIDFKKYCKQKGCEKDTHLLCVYGNLTKGKWCNGKIVSYPWTKAFIDIMIYKWNSQRIQVALGMQLNKEKELYPRAYGMARMHWDEDLAKIAEFIAMHCMPKAKSLDKCLAIDNFPNPYLLAVINPSNISAPFLQETVAFHNCIIPKSRLSNYTSAFDNQTDFKFTPGDTSYAIGDIFFCFAFLWHTAEAVGCFTTVWESDNRTYYYCVLSSALERGKPVYLLSIPKGHSATCGCYPGWVETPGCLCVKKKDYVTKSTIPYFGTANKLIPAIEGKLEYEISEIYIDEVTAGVTKSQVTNVVADELNEALVADVVTDTVTETQLTTIEPVIQATELSIHNAHTKTISLRHSTSQPYFLLAFEVSSTQNDMKVGKKREPTQQELEEKERKELIDRFFNLSLGAEPDSYEVVTRYGEDKYAILAEKKRQQKNLRRSPDSDKVLQKQAVAHLTLLFDALTEEVTRHKPEGKAREYFDMKMKSIYNLLHKQDRRSNVAPDKDIDFETFILNDGEKQTKRPH